MGLFTGAGLFSGAHAGRGQNWRLEEGEGSVEAMHRTGMKTSQEAQKPKILMPYVDPLPVPAVIRPAQHADSLVQIRMREFHHKVHRDLPPTRLWGYNGTWPGPTFEVRRGQAFSVKWTNELPTKHFLLIDTTIHGAEEGVPEVRTVVHVHGAKVLPETTKSG